MENKTIIPVALLVTALCVMLMFADNIKSAYAITYVDTAITTPIASTTHTINGIHYISMISETGDAIRTFRASTGVLYTTSSTFTTVCESGGTAGTCVPRAMKCISSTCYVLASVTVGVAVCRFLEVAVGGGSSVKYTSSTACNNAFAMNGNQIYYVRINGGADELNVLNTATNPYTATVLSADLGVGSVYCMNYITMSTVSYIAVCSDVANNWFKLWRLDTASICSVGASTFTAINVAEYNNLAYVVESGGTIKVITPACAISTTITSANLCGGTGQDIAISGVKLFYACESTKNVTYYNLTSSTPVATYDCGYTVTPASNTVRMISYDSSVDSLSCMAYTGNEVRFMLGITGTSDGSDSSSNQVDGRCGNGTALDCVGDRSTINMITGSPAISDTANNLFTGIGIVNSTNTDIQTNGTGLLLMLITGTFFASAVVGTIAMANNKFNANISYTDIPKEFWLFLVIGVVAVAFYLEWIPSIVFYSLVIGLAGLFSFGLYKHFSGRGG